MQQKNAQQVRRAGAHRLEDGEHVHALLKVRVHGHGHADGAQHHGDQADEAQNRGGVVKPVGQRRIPFAIVRHLRVGQRVFHLLAHRDRIGRCRQLEQQPPAGPVTRAQQRGLVKRRPGDHHPRPNAGTGRDAVRLLPEHRRDAEGSAAQAERLPHMRVQPDEKLLRHHHGVALQSLLQADVRLQFRVAVERIDGGVHGLEGHQNGNGIRRHGGHGDGFDHPGGADSLLRESVDLCLLRGGWLMKDARAQVPGHQGARLSAERAPEAVTEAAHAHQRGDADGYGEHHEAKLAGSRLQVTPTDCGGALPA